MGGGETKKQGGRKTKEAMAREYWGDERIRREMNV